MNPLEWHGIDHLSAGSLNLWMANPREWAVRYLAKEGEEADPAMWRGSAVEAGLARLLHGRSLQDARAAASDSFELNAVGELSDEVEAERSLVLPMLHRASTWTAPGELAGSQLRIEHWLDGVSVPLVGYLDFAFLSGIDVDLKTTRACPGKPRGNHVRQVALYRAARGRRGGLLYVTDKKLAYFEINDADAEEALDDLRPGALSLAQFLGKVRDADDALACLPYNPDDFRTTPKVQPPIETVLLRLVMFSEQQKVALAAPLNVQHVKRRKQAGRSLPYIEGWKAIEEANRIFGFDGWTRETVDLRCVAEKEREIGADKRPGWGVSYVAKIRVVVFAGDARITREGLGSGHGIDSDLGNAHESAVKEAETDAMKRALMTFGNPFGLALYDKDQTNVGDDGADTKGKFIAECRHVIAQFDKAEALVAWWNCDLSKQCRRDFKLTRDEVEGLKGLVLQRKAQLKQAA